MNPENIFAKIKHPFMITSLSKLGMEKNFLIPMKEIYKHPTDYLILNVKFECFFSCV